MHSSEQRADYLYDGEGQVCAVMSPSPISGGSAVMTQYIYDAEGTRVAKGSISSWSCDTTANGFTPTNQYILGQHNEQLTEMTVDSSGAVQWDHTNVYAGGQLLATYDNNGLHFQLADWLGTRRVQTDFAGNTEETCSSLPFGDQLNCQQTDLNTADDATEHHFTGKERDSESGNDYFFARYYSSMMGRFMSPDWAAKAEPVPYSKLDDPQSLNLYSYVGNNPLSRIDADGHETLKPDPKPPPPTNAQKDAALPKPDADHNHTIVVREVAGQNGNVAGHVTVQVDGGKEVGFGPKDTKGVLENKSVPGQIEPRAPGVKTLDSVTINVTEAQAGAANQTIADRTANPGNYQLVGNSCVNFGEQVMTSAGAPTQNVKTPGGLVEVVRQQQYHDNSTQTPH